MLSSVRALGKYLGEHPGRGTPGTMGEHPREHPVFVKSKGEWKLFQSENYYPDYGRFFWEIFKQLKIWKYYQWHGTYPPAMLKLSISYNTSWVL